MVNRKIDICLTPFMLDLFDLSNKQVVIIDVFRATSAICMFLHNDGEFVVPIATLEDAKMLKKMKKCQNNYLFAAERNGEIVPGFDLGNSPLLYDGKSFSNNALLITTTNGTAAIEKSKYLSKGMLLASFLNVQSVVDYIINSEKSNVLIVCSGWKGRTCVEDILLGGLISKKLLVSSDFYTDSDSVFLAQKMYDVSSKNIFQFLSSSSYRMRMNLDEDVKYCLQMDIIDSVPVWFREEHNGFSGYFSLNKQTV